MSCVGGGWAAEQEGEGQVGQELRCSARVAYLFPSNLLPTPRYLQPFQCPPPLEKLNWDSIPSQLSEFRSSCPRLVEGRGEGPRNAGAEAWAAPDRAGSEFWECLCSWSPLGEGARPLINPSLVPWEGPGPCTRVEGDGAPLQEASSQPSAPCLVESQTEAWRSWGPAPRLHGAHVCGKVCGELGVWAHVRGP